MFSESLGIVDAVSAAAACAGPSPSSAWSLPCSGRLRLCSQYTQAAATGLPSRFSPCWLEGRSQATLCVFLWPHSPAHTSIPRLWRLRPLGVQGSARPLFSAQIVAPAQGWPRGDAPEVHGCCRGRPEVADRPQKERVPERKLSKLTQS